MPETLAQRENKIGNTVVPTVIRKQKSKAEPWPSIPGERRPQTPNLVLDGQPGIHGDKSEQRVEKWFLTESSRIRDASGGQARHAHQGQQGNRTPYDPED